MEGISRDRDSLEALQSLLQIRSRGRPESSVSQKDTPTIIIPTSNSESPTTIQQEKRQHHILVSKEDLTSNNKSQLFYDNRIHIHGHPHQQQRAQEHEIDPQNLQRVLNLLPQQDHLRLASSPRHQQQLFFPSMGSGMPMTTSPAAVMSSSSSSSVRTNNLTAAALVEVQLAAARAAMVVAASAAAAVSDNQRQQPISPPSNGGINLCTRQQVPNPLLSMDQNSICTTTPSFSNINATMTGGKNSDISSTCTTTSISREKVEAALRSKSQRGKKRDDLSAKERLELTRSRNREHAKTTRIRKKARHQELLDCETKLRTLLRQEETEGLQRKVIETFISLRQNMIRCCHSSSSAGHQEEEDGINNDTNNMPSLGYDYEQPKVPMAQDAHHAAANLTTLPEKENELKLPTSASSSSSAEQQQVTAMTPPTKPVDHASILAKLVHNVNEFYLQVSPKIDGSIMENHATASSSSSSFPASSLSAMKTLTIIDQQCVDRATRRYGVAAQKYFSYQVSDDGIALTKNNIGGTTSITAMAKIELYMELGPFNKTHLQTCLLKASFDASQSLLLKSVEWTVLQDSLLLLDSTTTISTNNNADENSSISSSARRAAFTTPLSGQIDASLMETTARDSSNPLQSQSVFPSFVSLEQSKTTGSAGSNTSLGMTL